jgi:hypothetical protein
LTKNVVGIKINVIMAAFFSKIAPFAGATVLLHAGDFLTKTYTELGNVGQFLRFEKSAGSEAKIRVTAL